MPSKIQLSTLLLIAAILWGGSLMVTGIAIPVSWFRPFHFVLGATVASISAFDLWLWHLSWLQGWFVKRPDIRGTWRGTVRSNWTDLSTGRTAGDIEGYMAVRQTYSWISLRLMTSESSSELLGAEIISSRDGTFKIVAVYRNEPKMAVRSRSPIHHGAIIMELIKTPQLALRGHYWTDRDTNGDIELVARLPQTFGDFQSARDAFVAQVDQSRRAIS